MPLILPNTDAWLATSDITTNDVSITKHGFAPKAPNDTTKFLRGDATWAVPAGGSGYSIFQGSGTLTTTNSVTGYIGAYNPSANFNQQHFRRIVVPVAITITKIYFYFYCTGSAPSNEQSTLSFRKNATTDTTISSTVDLSGITTSAPVLVSNTGLSIAMSAGDYFELKWVSPAWASPPSGNVLGSFTAYGS